MSLSRHFVFEKLEYMWLKPKLASLDSDMFKRGPFSNDYFSIF